ncbi:MAG: tRNA guanosine(34) transglycosylase Tgt [Deltaproteobacteria bacterium]|nr:tRNA guanosine(34) transglycosylase Tgt [Deltaproteobacteria bacterium]MBI2534403.1 tRNA guanosine(34) transglycosylase Tgt [Deltaproteobacteria bacterium]
MADHFTLIKKDASSNARLGRLVTAHGVVETPAFMPVGTQGTVKAMLPRDLKELGCQILLGNTYHLYLRPGHDVIHKLGGLHKFMGWDGPILTDSGGYQIFSLAPTCKITEEGARFQSHLDGSSHLLTPEKAVEVQEALGSDIAMALDECIPHDASCEYVRESTARTIRWAQRGLRARGRTDQLMFGILQGGLFEDQRRWCAEEMIPMPFDGFAVGGLGVGEGEDLLRSIGSFTAGLLPENRPRYLMGVGRPEDIVEAVRAGFDLFDCVIPTRNARNGTLFTSQGKLSIKRAEFADDPRPLDETCGCYACRNFSRAYLRHLFMAGEILSAQLNSLHNLYFYHRLMDKCREAIRDGSSERWPRWLEADTTT